MKQLYLDLFSGASGDMFIGALLDLGVDPAALEAELKKLNLSGYHLHVGRRLKMGIEGVKFDVHTEHDAHTHAHTHTHSHPHTHAGEHAHPHPPETDAGTGEHVHPHSHEHCHDHRHVHEPEQECAHEHAKDAEHAHAHEPGHSHEAPHEHGNEADHEHGRTYQEIRELIQSSQLSDWVKRKSLAVFHRIAEAEGKIHGVPVDEVAFHEVGAVDSIVDVVGACIALEMLDKPRVVASGVTEGRGTVRCAHGRFPIPAPATLAILGARGIAITQCDEPHELVTPTGAAILAEFVESFGPMQNVVAESIGYGLGARDNRSRPNVLRAVLGAAAEPAGTQDWESDRVMLLETNLDDISAEILGDFIERSLAAGALDVWHTPIQMKKNRPGTLLSLLCAEADADRLTELMLTNTSAFGVRRTAWERRKLRREFTTVATVYGSIEVKLGTLNGKVVQAAPEFESCKEAAARAGVPLRSVYEAATIAVSESQAKEGGTP